LLHAQAAYRDFDGAAETHQLAMEMIEKLKSKQYNNSNHAALFAEFSVLFYIRSEYDEAHRCFYIIFVISEIDYNRQKLIRLFS